MTRVRFVRLCSFFLVICLVFSVAACGNQATNSSPSTTPVATAASTAKATEATPATSTSTEKIDLRLFFWFSAEDLPAWKAGIDEILVQNPQVNINIETAAWSDYWTKLQTQVATSSQPDIFGMVSMNSDFYIQNKALLNMTPYIEKDSFKIDDFWPGMMKAYTYEGGVYCLPYDLSTNLLICNLDLFSKAGVAFDSEGWTMDKFLENSKIIKEKTGAYATSLYPSGWVLYDYLLATGVNTVQDSNGYLKLDTPEIAERVQWMADLNLVNKVAPVYDPTATGLFESGKIAIVSGNPEWVANMRMRMPDVKLDVMKYPYQEGKPRVRTSEGGSFTISAVTKYPDLCWKFVSAFTSAESLKKMVGLTHRGIPGRISVASSMLESKNKVDHSKLFFDILEGSSYVTFPKRTEVETILQQYLDQIYLGSMKADEALKKFMAEATPIMSN